LGLTRTPKEARVAEHRDRWIAYQHDVIGNDQFSTRIRSWRVGPVSYLAMENYGEYAPLGRHRWLFVGGRVCVAYGPEHGVSEGIPDTWLRCRWLRGGRRALALVWCAPSGQEQER
jgi:hypothetical protein